jgi:S-adenosylmethionine synthetase
MKLSLHVQPNKIDDSNFEVVERKGIGHPDTLADGIAEAVSIAYSKYCLEKFGAILHHNVDKTTVTGGLVDIDFGRGVMNEKAKVIVNGRMSTDFAGEKIDVVGIQEKAVKDYLKKVLPQMDVENWLEFESTSVPYSHNPYWYHPRGLEDLPELKIPRANDTSTCVGYWPLSVGENLALGLEGWFYNTDSQPKFSYIGQDIKCMVVRKKQVIDITMNIPFIPQNTPSVEFYKTELQKIKSSLIELADKIAPDYEISLQLNGMDNDQKNDYYLLLTGSCIEAGEEGVVGRGNKSRGVISSNRPFSMEAPNGKNPVYHVGKIHTVVADALAEKIGIEFDCHVDVFITTKIGDPLYDPENVVVQASKEIDYNRVLAIVKEFMDRRDWTDQIVHQGVLLPKPFSL